MFIQSPREITFCCSMQIEALLPESWIAVPLNLSLNWIVMSVSYCRPLTVFSKNYQTHRNMTKRQTGKLGSHLSRTLSCKELGYQWHTTESFELYRHNIWSQEMRNVKQSKRYSTRMMTLRKILTPDSIIRHSDTSFEKTSEVRNMKANTGTVGTQAIGCTVCQFLWAEIEIVCYDKEV